MSEHTTSLRFFRHCSLLLLIFVLLYSFINQYDTYQVIGDNILKDLPIYSVDIGTKKQICITFDSAWGTEDLSDILSILKKHSCTATFFVTGQWAKNNPDAIGAITSNGHLIGNHGANHKHMTQLSREEMATEIISCHETIKQITGKNMLFFRAPYGDYNDTVVDVAKECNYYTIQWSVDSLDWKDYGVDSIIETVCNHSNLEGGAIILLHNGTTYTKDALDKMLTQLERKGYSYISLDKLIYRENYEIDHTGKQIPIP